MMRRFRLIRTRDVSGKSGTGEVAAGVVADDGAVAMRWTVPGMPKTWNIFDSVADLLKIHDHGETTHIRWVDRAPFEARTTTEE